VRVSDAADSAVNDVSDADFSILTQRTVTLTDPTGAEEWEAASSHDITWTSTGDITNVKLEYSKDGFSSDVNTIVASTTDDGTYSWTIPEDASTTVRVRISDASDSAVNDLSNADFTISTLLRHWWKFDETSGTDADDTVGTTDGTLENGAGWDASGKLNGALDLDGDNDVVEVVDDDTLDVGADDSVTFAIWFKATGDDENQYLFSKDDSGDKYYLKLESDGDLKAVIDEDGAGKSATLTVSGNYDDDAWHHVVIVVNRTSDIMYIYVDGNQEGSDNDISNVGDISNSGNLYIGAKDSSGTDEFGGLIDEFRFYDEALSSSQVTALYASYS